MSLRPSWAVSKDKNQKELKKKKKRRASKMVHYIKAFVANPDDPSSSPGIYMVQGEKQLLKVVSGLHRWTAAYVRTRTKEP